MLILLSALKDESRYSDIVFTYETYLNTLKQNNVKGFILNEHLEIYSKALYIMVKIIICILIIYFQIIFQI